MFDPAPFSQDLNLYDYETRILSNI